MYDLITGIISHAWSTNSSEQSIIYYICGALICLFSVVFIDLIRDIFCGFFRG